MHESSAADPGPESTWTSQVPRVPSEAEGRILRALGDVSHVPGLTDLIREVRISGECRCGCGSLRLQAPGPGLSRDRARRLSPGGRDDHLGLVAVFPLGGPAADLVLHLVDGLPYELELYPGPAEALAAWLSRLEKVEFR